jgi:hypothetical protein
LDTPLIVTKISSEQVAMLHGDITIGTVWATERVLDIPQAPTLAQARAISAMRATATPAVLFVALVAPIPGDQELVVYCWPLGKEGRKLFGEVAIANQQGKVLACASSVWIELAAK